MSNFEDKTNKKFNMLIAKEYLGNNMWRCECECGNEVEVKSALLNEVPGKKKVKSCGCLLRKNIPDNEDFFEKIDSEEKAYVLGFIAADGAVQPQANKIKIDLKSVDEDILLKIQKAMGHHNKLSHYINKNRTFEDKTKFYDCPISRLVINSKKIVEDIQKYGVGPKKSNTLNIRFDLIPDEFFFDFLRGYFDGDGCLSFSREKKYTDLNFTSSTIVCIKLKEIIKDKMGEDRFYLYHRRKENLQNATIICTKTYFIVDLLKKMYNNSTIYLDRKHKKYLDFLKEYDF